MVSYIGIGEAETSIGAQAAAAQAQMMKDIQELAREDGERAAAAKELIERTVPSMAPNWQRKPAPVKYINFC